LAAIKSRRRLRSVDAPQRRARLLSALVVCAECGQRMRVRYNDHPTQAAQYACDPSKSKSCGKAVVSAEAVEAEVEKRFLVVLNDPETLIRLDQLRDDAPDVSALLDERERLQHEYEAEAADYGAGRTPRTVWQATKQEMQKRLDRL